MPSSSPSDSETYSTTPSPHQHQHQHHNHTHNNHDNPRPSNPSSSASPQTPLILYTPPTVFSLLRGAAINLLLPFINGLMLGFGELLANEAAFRLGWSGTKIFPTHRSAAASRVVGPGVEIRADPVERRRRSGEEMDMWTSME